MGIYGEKKKWRMGGEQLSIILKSKQEHDFFFPQTCEAHKSLVKKKNCSL